MSRLSIYLSLYISDSLVSSDSNQKCLIFDRNETNLYVWEQLLSKLVPSLRTKHLCTFKGENQSILEYKRVYLEFFGLTQSWNDIILLPTLNMVIDFM